MVGKIFITLALPLFLLIGYLVFNLYRRLNLFGVFRKENKTLLDLAIMVVVTAISAWIGLTIMAYITHILGIIE